MGFVDTNADAFYEYKIGQTVMCTGLDGVGVITDRFRAVSAFTGLQQFYMVRLESNGKTVEREKSRLSPITT